jgi:hypothetical protein
VNFGGPILKDKLFFFLDYEGFRQTLKPLSVLTLPTQNELNGILVVDVQNPSPAQVYPAGTPFPPLPSTRSRSRSSATSSRSRPARQAVCPHRPRLQRLLRSGPLHRQLRQGRPAPRLPAERQQLLVPARQRPQGDRRQLPRIPLPLDGQTNGTIRVLDQQVALGYTHLFGANKVLDARVGLSRTKAGKFSLSIGDNAFNDPRPAHQPVVAGGLPSIGISGFTAFGRQSTNPQWQNPACSIPRSTSPGSRASTP